MSKITDTVRPHPLNYSFLLHCTHGADSFRTNINSNKLMIYGKRFGFSYLNVFVKYILKMFYTGYRWYEIIYHFRHT